MDAPASDQIEINIFGPGFGECCLIHVGEGEWVIIDSCVEQGTNQPTSLKYLDAIGVDTSSVRLIIASHWHDDHIRGLAETLKRCESARFCTSSALSNEEFIATVTAFDEYANVIGGSGATEICRVLELLQARAGGQAPTRALANRLLLQRDANTSTHGRPVAIWSLSPSDAQFQAFLREIGNLVPKAYETKRRAPAQKPNHLSVVVCATFGDIGLLFGADLETTADERLGWAAIVGSSERPQIRSQFFKIPHHGSITGHHDETWEQIVSSSPLTVLTPWNRGTGLPTSTDVSRIVSRSGRAFTTNKIERGSGVFRSNAVDRQLREMRVVLRPTPQRPGHVRVRLKVDQPQAEWEVTLDGGACSLSEL